MQIKLKHTLCITHTHVRSTRHQSGHVAPRDFGVGVHYPSLIDQAAVMPPCDAGCHCHFSDSSPSGFHLLASCSMFLVNSTSVPSLFFSLSLKTSFFPPFCSSVTTYCKVPFKTQGNYYSTCLLR